MDIRFLLLSVWRSCYLCAARLFARDAVELQKDRSFWIQIWEAEPCVGQNFAGKCDRLTPPGWEHVAIHPNIAGYGFGEDLLDLVSCAGRKACKHSGGVGAYAEVVRRAQGKYRPVPAV